MKYYAPSKISENIHETPEGFLVCIGVPIARTGLQEYGEGETPLETADGVIQIQRDEKEVFHPRTIASFEGKAITIRHPTNFVNPENWSELAKGILQNVRRGKDDSKDDLIADLLITDKMAIGLVKNGLREVSCGYEADYEQVEKGKGIQKNIIGNHLALVDQGRAGPGYAINDHKGEKNMTLKERIKAIFAKAQDEAMQMAADEEKKEDKAKDEDKEKKEEKAKDDKGAGYDELVQMVKDLGEKIEGMKPAKDEDEDKEKKSDDEDKEKKEDKAKDDDKVEASIEDRLKALEAAISKLLDKKSGDEDSDGDDDESEDDDFDESTLVGDTVSRAEILAPGIKMSKDVKAKALKTAYETKEGKKVIDSLTSGKPTFDSAEVVNTLFVAASEVIKAQRQDELSKTKRTKDDSGNGTIDNGAMTAEKMNEINANFYKKV